MYGPKNQGGGYNDPTVSAPVGQQSRKLAPANLRYETPADLDVQKSSSGVCRVHARSLWCQTGAGENIHCLASANIWESNAAYLFSCNAGWEVENDSQWDSTKSV